jgi:hypothetical protein
MFDEFMEFVTAKQQAEANAADDDDEVEVWDEKGRGARIRKRDAKPFLQSLGILLDPPSESSDDSPDDKSKGNTGRKPGRTATSTAATASNATSTVKKYFSKPKP